MANMAKVFLENVRSIPWEGAFVRALCGPKSYCVQGFLQWSLAGSDGSVLEQDLLEALGIVDEKITTRTLYSDRDESLPRRWAALSKALRSCLAKEGQCYPPEAIYRDLWNDTEREALGNDSSIPSLRGGVNASGPQTAEGWIVEDIRNQIKFPAPTGLIETTPVLFDGGDGLVLRLVVEGLPGPPGLVTPNHWLLGLIPFPCDVKEPRRHIPAAFQRVMRLALPKGVPLRLRWHFEGYDVAAFEAPLTEPSVQSTEPSPLIGRSIEAAAACAVLAIAERYLDGQKPHPKPGEKATRRIKAMLDENVAVTGSIDIIDATDFQLSKIQPVDDGGLESKFAAAAANGIDTVCLANDVNKNDVPPGTRPKKVTTVKEAYHILDNCQDILDNYREHVRSQWEKQWDEQETQTP